METRGLSKQRVVQSRCRKEKNRDSILKMSEGSVNRWTSRFELRCQAGSLFMRLSTSDQDFFLLTVIFFFLSKVKQYSEENFPSNYAMILRHSSSSSVVIIFYVTCSVLHPGIVKAFWYFYANFGAYLSLQPCVGSHSDSPIPVSVDVK